MGYAKLGRHGANRGTVSQQVHDPDTVMPHRLASPDPREQEEERRVFHVALTRGRRSLEVLTDRTAPSPYLDELTP
ncbi:MAG: hypothetical protein M3252_05275, partial [Actinomycetota bacterium]|nr:hypothetical protein [Actinomycetota bacterium]